MDFYVVNAGTSIDNQFPRLRLTSSPDSAAANVLALEEGGYDFAVTTEGTKDLRLGPIGITVMGGGIYSIYVTDAAGGGEPLEAVLVDDFTP